MLELFYKCLVASLLAISHPDETLLQNIEQITFSEMGFQKAGEAYFSPDSQMISFQAVPIGERGYQIFTMNLASRSIQQISQGAQNCTCSFFHPDGKKILFAASPKEVATSSGEKYKWDFTPYMNIYEANIDGSDPVQLTFGEAYHAECAYSPDGTHIVYACNQDGSMNIYTMKRDGSDVRQLTHTTHCYNGGPFFSPDGTQIVFRADREIPDHLQIYVMDIDGSNLSQITHNDAVNWAPFWHPNNKAIAYSTSIHGHHNYEIYLHGLQSGKEFRVTHHPAFDGLSTFNSDGTKMMWTSKRALDKSSQIFMADFQLPEDL